LFEKGVSWVSLLQKLQFFQELVYKHGIFLQNLVRINKVHVFETNAHADTAELIRS
jgi:hypothetical protein